MVVWGSRHGDECRVSREVERCLKVYGKGSVERDQKPRCGEFATQPDLHPTRSPLVNLHGGTITL